MTPLIDRIERRQPNEKIVPLVERRVPEWIRRMQEGKLPDKDMTNRVAA